MKRYLVLLGVLGLQASPAFATLDLSLLPVCEQGNSDAVIVPEVQGNYYNEKTEKFLFTVGDRGIQDVDPELHFKDQRFNIDRPIEEIIKKGYCKTLVEPTPGEYVFSVKRIVTTWVGGMSEVWEYHFKLDNGKPVYRTYRLDIIAFLYFLPAGSVAPAGDYRPAFFK
ncbi:hypothetical protein K2X30_15200 [bacterium]|nr:hypothetical protein [bacterium]